MSKIWYCPNCGYEMATRGRCHLCRQRLVASDLPELPAGAEEDEVGYRLDGWADRERGRLIERLNLMEIVHRFEDDELVVGADDEARVDDLIEELATSAEESESPGENGAGEGPAAYAESATTAAGVRLLADAAARLRRDPTDMHADADVAEASAAVFMADGYAGLDEDTWAAVGRVTRRLLSALGADEALDEEIRTEAAILEKLLSPVAGVSATASGDGVSKGDVGGDDLNGDDLGGKDLDEEGLDGDDLDEDESPEDETLYELPEWLPEQRAQLSVLLDGAHIGHEWDGDDLVVAADHEAEVEALFDQVGAPADDDDEDGGETRYHALEELFAAADRLAGDPADEQRAADAVLRIEDAAGPPPFGLDEVQWFRIMSQARVLSESIRSGHDEHAIGQEAAALRDLLRAVV